MTDATLKELKQQGLILGIAFAFYIVLSVIAMLWVKYFPMLLPKKIHVNKNEFNGATDGDNVAELNVASVAQDNQKRALVMWMMLIFGSTTFFGLPIIKILFASNAVIAVNMWNIPYRIFLYSFAFMVMAGLKFDKQNIKQSAKTALLNPIVIATFTGLVLWLTQLIPHASEFDANFATGGLHGWFNFNITIPYIYTPINTVGALSSPLVWLSIGITLASSSLLDAVKDKWVWIFSVQKLILIPLLIFLVMLALLAGNLVDKDVATAMVIFAATPPATVVVAYAMQYKTAEKFSTQCSALCTIGAVIFIPLWIIVSQATFGAV